MTCGVAQGSILGPLPISLFINDIFQVCRYSTMHGYADDLHIYLSGPLTAIDNLCKLMNIDLVAINYWTENNKLSLNPLKSIVLPISKSNFHHDFIPPLRLGNTNLNIVSKVTNLGCIVNSKLSCEDHHIDYVVSKINYIILLYYYYIIQ